MIYPGDRVFWIGPGDQDLTGTVVLSLGDMLCIEAKEARDTDGDSYGIYPVWINRSRVMPETERGSIA